jgi:hypothetical protein
MAYLSFRVTALRLIDLKGDGPSPMLELADHQAGEAREAFAAALQTETTT